MTSVVRFLFVSLVEGSRGSSDVFLLLLLRTGFLGGAEEEGFHLVEDFLSEGTELGDEQFQLRQQTR